MKNAEQQIKILLEVSEMYLQSDYMRNLAAEAITLAHRYAIIAKNRVLLEMIKRKIALMIIPWHKETLRLQIMAAKNVPEFDDEMFHATAQGFKILHGGYGSGGDRGLINFNKRLAKKLEKQWDKTR